MTTSAPIANSPNAAQPKAKWDPLMMIPLIEVVRQAYPTADIKNDGLSRKFNDINYKVILPDNTKISVVSDHFNFGWAKAKEGQKSTGGVGNVMFVRRALKLETDDEARKWLAEKFPMIAQKEKDGPPPGWDISAIMPKTVDASRKPDKPTGIQPIKLPNPRQELAADSYGYLTQKRHFYPEFSLQMISEGFFAPGKMANVKPEFNDRVKQERIAHDMKRISDPSIGEYKAPVAEIKDKNFYTAMCTPMWAYDDIALPRASKRITGYSQRATCPLAPGDDIAKKNFNGQNAKTAGGAIIPDLTPETRAVVFTESPIEAASYFQLFLPPKEVAVVGVCGEGLPEELIAVMAKHNMVGISAFNNDFSGRKFCARVGEMLEKKGLQHRRHIPEEGYFNLGVEDTPALREKLNLLKKTADESRASFEVVKREDALLGVKCSSNDATTKAADEIREYCRETQKKVDLVFKNKDWDDQLLLERKRVYEQAIQHLEKQGHAPEVVKHLFASGYFSPIKVPALVPTPNAAGGTDLKRKPIGAVSTPMVSITTRQVKKIEGFSNLPLVEGAVDHSTKPYVNGAAMVGQLTPATKHLVLCTNAVSAAAYWQVVQPSENVCVLGICQDKIPEAVFKLARQYKMGVVSAFDVSEQGLSLHKQAMELCAKHGIQPKLHQPKVEKTGTKTAVEEKDRQESATPNKGPAKEELKVSHVETDLGGFDFKVDASKGSRHMAKDLREHSRVQGAEFKIEYADDEWLDALQAKRYGIVREKSGVVHNDHSALVEKEEIRLATEIDRDHRQEDAKQARVDLDNQQRASIAAEKSSPTAAAPAAAKAVPASPAPVAANAPTPKAPTAETPAEKAKPKGMDIGSW